jgi:hypothetical protein
MLIVALVLAVIGLAALVTAVATSNELIAWVCIVASVIGVLLLIVDALRERSRRAGGDATAGPDEPQPEFDEDYPDEVPADQAEADEVPADQAEADEVPADQAKADDTAVEPRDDTAVGEERNSR